MWLENATSRSSLEFLIFLYIRKIINSTPISIKYSFHFLLNNYIIFEVINYGRYVELIKNNKRTIVER